MTNNFSCQIVSHGTDGELHTKKINLKNVWNMQKEIDTIKAGIVEKTVEN